MAKRRKKFKLDEQQLKKYGVIAGLVFLVAFIIGTGSYLAVYDCRDVFCDQYEFICCGQMYEATETKSINTQAGIYFCPSYATQCVVDITRQTMVGTFYVATPEASCGFDVFGWRVCDNYVAYNSNQYDLKLAPGAKVYVGAQYVTPASIVVSSDVYKRVLGWCGDSPCNPGDALFEVAGTTGCGWVTDSSAYDEYGHLVKAVNDTEVSVTVPYTPGGPAMCYQVKKVGDRRICGSTCDECETSLDCADGRQLVYNGHGATCESGLVHVYDCIDPSEACLEWDILATGERYCVKGWSGTKICSSIDEFEASCCPGTSCGIGMFCSPETFTCVPNLACSADWECGIGSVCDYTKNPPVIVSKKCENGYCVSKTDEVVDCCYDLNCPSGFYCDADHSCKEEVGPKLPCPYQCCNNSNTYIDKLCDGNEICCNNNMCSVSGKCEDESSCDYNCGTLDVVCTIKEIWCQILQMITAFIEMVMTGLIYVGLILLVLFAVWLIFQIIGVARGK